MTTHYTFLMCWHSFENNLIILKFKMLFFVCLKQKLICILSFISVSVYLLINSCVLKILNTILGS